MAIEITAWAPTRAAAIAFMQAVNIATVDENDNIVSISDVLIDPFRPSEELKIEATPAVMDGMTVITPATYVSGWHWNMRFYGQSEITLTKPTPPGGWTEADDIFARTYINELVASRTGVIPAWSDAGVIPPGYEAGQCRAFDPALIATRARVWQ